MAVVVVVVGAAVIVLIIISVLIIAVISANKVHSNNIPRVARWSSLLLFILSLLPSTALIYKQEIFNFNY